MNWPNEIVRLVKVKEELASVDTQQLWGWHLPEGRASEEDLSAVDHKLGAPLDGRYRDFLRFANGWRSFYQKVPRDRLLPIATTLEDRDLFVLDLETGEVIWLAGEEIDRYPNFDEYFAAMVAYNQQEIESARRR
jgi:hypothetical protein